MEIGLFSSTCWTLVVIFGSLLVVILCRWFRERLKEMVNKLGARIIIEVILLVIACVGLWFNFYQLGNDAKATKDMYLTGVWNEIMKETIQYPAFADPSKTLTYKNSFKSSQRQQYEVYARWVGGYLEDLYVKEYEKDWPYYKPWVDDMIKLHETWLVDNMDIYKNTDAMYSQLMKLKDKRPNKTLEGSGTNGPNP